VANPGPRAKTIFEAIGETIPAATIQARLDEHLSPRVGASRAELVEWAETLRPYIVKGRKRGGPDRDAYRLGRAGVYCDRLRETLLVTGEQRHDLRDQNGTVETVVNMILAGGTPMDPMANRLVEGLAANPQSSDSALLRSVYDVPISEGKKLDEDGEAVLLDEAERYGELYAERSKVPALAAEGTLLPLADLAAGKDVDDLDLATSISRMAQMMTGPSFQVPDEMLEAIEPFVTDFLRAAMTEIDIDNPQALITEASDQDLARFVKAAIAFAEGPDREPATWKLIYTSTVSMFLTERIMPAIATQYGFDLTSIPGPWGKLPWTQPELNPSSGEI
jgi:hypothetical protein